MWPTLKRLSLGIMLIVAASAVLLVSDWRHRGPRSGRVPQIAILQHASQPMIEEGVQGMLDGLAELGLVEGKKLAVRRYNAENDMPTANAIAKEITGGQFDLILTATTVSMQAVANANVDGKTTHVFGLVSDPFGAGVGISRDNPLQHPRHLAGYGTLQPVAETFRLARRMFPGLQRVGEVWNPAEANSEANTRLARAACQDLGIELVEANADNTSGVMEAASSLIARGVQALWVGGDVTVLTAFDSVAGVARQARIPIFTSMPGSTKRGALFDLGANYHEVGRLTGVLAGEILHGKDPASVEIKNLMPEVLVVNRGAFDGLRDPWRLPDDMTQTAQFVGDGPSPVAVPQRRAGGRTYRIGLAYFAPEPGAENCMQGFLDGLRELGFVEGENLEVLRTHAQGEIANIPAMLQNLDSQDLDLIVPFTTPCLTAACGTVKNTPVVFTYVYDPIAAGAGTSFTDHHPNVTGVGSFPPVEDTVELIQRLVPGVQRVGTVYNSSEANSRKVVSVARDAFAAKQIRLEEATVVSSSEVFQAAQALVARGVQAFWITGDNTAIQGFDAIVKVSMDAGLPLINNDPEIAPQGALACVGIGFYQSGRAAAKLAAAVLGGATPAELPIQNLVVKTLSLNLTAARKLGVTFPRELLDAADVVIDENGVHERQPPPTPARAAKAASAPVGTPWKIDILEYVNVQDVEDGEHGIRAGLRDAGLAEGRDYELRVRNAQGDMPTLSSLIDAALSDGSELLMTLSTPTLQAAMQRTRDVPIVFTFVADAVAAGAGKSNEDHVPNVTGVPTTAAYDELVAVVRECLPNGRRLGTLFVPAEVNSVYNKDRLAEAATRHGFEFLTVAANTTAEVGDATLSLLARDVDAICQAGSNLTTAAFASIAQSAQRANIPVFGFLSSDFQNGAAVVVARDYFDGGHEAGLMAARIIRGESPARIPFQPLETARLLVNLETARAVGLTIPPSVRRRATQVIGG